MRLAKSKSRRLFDYELVPAGDEFRAVDGLIGKLVRL